MTTMQALTTGSSSIGSPIIFNRVHYNLVLASSPALATIPSIMLSTNGTLNSFTSANVATLDASYDFWANIAIYGKPHASIDWNKLAKLVNLNQMPITPLAYTASCMPILMLEKSPFFVDTGANTHILPECANFKTLHPISPHPITGLGGLYIFAVSISTIDIHITGGYKLILNNVLFAPTSTVCLVSILLLNNAGGRYTLHFSHDSLRHDAFWLTNLSGAMILCGSLHKQHRLYCLSLSKAQTTHMHSKADDIAPPDTTTTDTTPISAFHASCVPNVETWHRQLGHSL